MIPGEIGLMVYHWDADGVASAAMILRDRRVHRLAVPRIGHYTAQAIPVGEVDLSLPLLILDYGLGMRELEKLESRVRGGVVVVDHHLTDAESRGNVRVYNPSPGRAPSTTWVLRDLIQNPPLLPLLVGVAGDVGVELRDPVGREVEALLGEAGWSYGDVLELAERLNSCAPLLDYRCLLKAPRRLLEYGDDLDKALGDEDWMEAKERVEGEVEKLLAEAAAEERGGVLVYRLTSPLYLASRIGRRLAAANPGRIVVVVFDRMDGYTEIYVRRIGGGLSGPLNRLRELGLPVGGKDTVFASQIPSPEAEGILEMFLQVLVEFMGVEENG